MVQILYNHHSQFVKRRANKHRLHFLLMCGSSQAFYFGFVAALKIDASLALNLFANIDKMNAFVS